MEFWLVVDGEVGHSFFFDTYAAAERKYERLMAEYAEEEDDPWLFLVCYDNTCAPVGFTIIKGE